MRVPRLCYSENYPENRPEMIVLGVNEYATHLFRFLEDFLLRIIMLTYNKYPIIDTWLYELLSYWAQWCISTEIEKKTNYDRVHLSFLHAFFLKEVFIYCLYCFFFYRFLTLTQLVFHLVALPLNMTALGM